MMSPTAPTAPRKPMTIRERAPQPIGPVSAPDADVIKRRAAAERLKKTLGTSPMPLLRKGLLDPEALEARRKLREERAQRKASPVVPVKGEP